MKSLFFVFLSCVCFFSSYCIATECYIENEEFAIIEYQVTTYKFDAIQFYILNKHTGKVDKYLLCLFDPDAAWPFDIDKIMQHQPIKFDIEN